MDQSVNNRDKILDREVHYEYHHVAMGRPIGFDELRVLETIQDEFWNHGYSATSLDVIMKSTGLGKGSLYGAYGCKHDMYRLAFTDYCEWVIKDYEERLRGPDDGAIARLQKLIRTSASVDSGARRGCMLAKGTAEVAGRFADVDDIIEKTFKSMERALVQCVRQAQRAGDVDSRIDARAIAMTLLAVFRGMEALKRAGTTAASLSLVAKGALGLLNPTERQER